MKKRGKFFNNVIVPMVRDALSVLGVKTEEEIRLKIKRELTNEINSLKDSFEKTLNDALLEIRGSAETNKLELTDEQFDELALVVQDQAEKITNVSRNYIEQAETLEVLLDKIQLVATATTGKLESIKQEVDSSIKKSRVDTATAIKNTREKISDLSIELDAFIDTISEKIAELN